LDVGFKEGRRMTTYALGFKIRSKTSPMAKQYTGIILDDARGTVIKNWGPSSSQGQVQVKECGTSAGAVAALRDVYTKKSVDSAYDYMEVAFQVVALSEDYKTSLTKSDATKILNTFLKSTKAENGNLSPSANPWHSTRVQDGLKAWQTKTATVSATVTASRTKTSTPAGSVPTVEARFTKVEGDLKRPNGEVYRPREIMGHTDVALLRKFKETGIYVRLAGPPGAGKTALAEAAFPGLITVNGHGDMTVAHFVGSYLPDPKNGNSWVWHDGPLVRAMKEGKTLFVDEGTRIPTEVINILFSVMDGRGVLNIDDRPDLPEVKAKDGFYVIMGYNPETLGARALDEALISRFRVQIDVYTDFATAKIIGVPSVAIRIARNLETRDKKDRASGGPGVWVPQMRELITFRDLIQMKAGEDFALSTLVASCPRPQDIPILLQAIKETAKKDVSMPSLGKMV
jgi:hypothetical protein